MPEVRVNRRLAAVLAADVVGYSRLMGADEAGTLAALKRHREIVFDPAVVAHNGRIVKLIGDGTLAEFGSVVDAVNCALAVQRPAAPMREGNAGLPTIVLRIGINLGDVIIDSDDIYGDGVNVAARLETLARPGGICVSSVVHESVGNRIDVRFRDGGNMTVKNIDRPIRVWTWHPGDTATALPPSTASPASSIRKSSIAVLPFTNMSGDREQEYFSDGISEDIITDLSKISGLTVISRNSCFTYKGRPVDVRAVGRELGVRFVLEGSVRRAGNRVRITAQLTDTRTGGQLWADRFDRDLADLFAVQDDVTSRIVDALKVTLSPAEKARLADIGTSDIDAYDYLLRAREFLLGETKNRDTFERSVELLTRAVEVDPDYSLAYACLAWAYVYDYQNGWGGNSGEALRLASDNVDRAIEKDPNESLARVAASMVAMLGQDFERAKSEADLALVFNPNSAEAYACLGSICTFSGRPMEAIPLVERAILLDPAYDQQYLHLLGVANLLTGKYETAAAVLRQRILQVPETDFSRAALASTLGHLGELDEARRIWDELGQINPRYSFDGHFGRLPYTKEDVRRIADGLAKAGLPH
jgi:adenylate cyclase